MSARLLPLALLALALVAGCISAKKIYTEGMALETAGDYLGAAHAYAAALERDRSIPNVPGRLAVAGRQAVRQSVARAGGEALEQAARRYLDADALIERAARMSIEIERSADFARQRDDVLDLAVAARLDEAQANRDAGDYPAALGHIAGAQAFRPTADRRDAMRALTREVYGAWAEDDLDARRFRDGLAHVDAALALDADDALLDLRDEILDAGTVVAALLPSEAGDDLSTRFLHDLDDVLVEQRLAPPPVFVALTDPADVRRWDRQRRGRDGATLGDSPRRLGQATADLGADVGVVVVVGPLRREEAEGEARTETATVRASSVRRPYTLRPVTLTVSLQADVVMAAAGAGRLSCDRPVTVRASETYDLGATDGDWRDLDLDRRQRAAFAPDAPERALDRALDSLREALATQAAAEVSRCLSAQVQ